MSFQTNCKQKWHPDHGTNSCMGHGPSATLHMCRQCPKHQEMAANVGDAGARQTHTRNKQQKKDHDLQHALTLSEHAGIFSREQAPPREGDASRGHQCVHGGPRRSGVVGPVTPSAASETILHAAQESLHARNTQKQVRKLEMVLIEGFCVGGVLMPLRKKNFSLTCCLPPIVEFVCNQLCGLMCDIPSSSSSALKSFNMH